MKRNPLKVQKKSGVRKILGEPKNLKKTSFLEKLKDVDFQIDDELFSRIFSKRR